MLRPVEPDEFDYGRDVEEAAEPLGWRPLREEAPRAGRREIRIFEPSWSMFARPQALLRVVDRGGVPSGEYALKWSVRQESRNATRRGRPFHRESLSRRGCVERFQVGDRVACPIPLDDALWRTVLQRLDSMRAWSDPDSARRANLPPGQVYVGGGACADVPRLEVFVLDGDRREWYSADGCGSPEARALMEALFDLLEEVEAASRRPPPPPGRRGHRQVTDTSG